MSGVGVSRTLYFLNSSRAIRIAWLLEELGLEYELVAADRAPNGLAPPEFKAKIPVPLGKSPTVQDGDNIVTESGAIVEYLCERYDTTHRLVPSDAQERATVREWLHAAEATFMLHATAITYAKWTIPEGAKQHLGEMITGMSRNTQNDLSWLEGVLKEQKSKGYEWIVGKGLTVADIEMQFRWVPRSLA